MVLPKPFLVPVLSQQVDEIGKLPFHALATRVRGEYYLMPKAPTGRERERLYVFWTRLSKDPGFLQGLEITSRLFPEYSQEHEWIELSPTTQRSTMDWIKAAGSQK